MRLLFFIIITAAAIVLPTNGVHLAKVERRNYSGFSSETAGRERYVRNAQNDEEIAERKSISLKLLETENDLREYISSKINEVYEIMKELAKSNDWRKTLKIDVDEIPPVADGFYVGKFNKTYKLASMRYADVNVFGMSGFKNYVISIDRINRKANISLEADQLRISGNYTLSNFVKHHSGTFTVTLSKVTYTEKGVFCKFNDEVDIASAEATTTFAKSESRYRIVGPLGGFLEGVVFRKMTEEILYRVGKEIGHRIRHVVTSKLRQTVLMGNQPSEYNRITSIVQSGLSQIRTVLNRMTTIKVPLPGLHHEFKVRKNFIRISNVTLTGLQTLHLDEEVKTYVERDELLLEMKGEAGPLTIAGQLNLTEAKNSTLVPLMLGTQYEASNVEVSLVVSCSLLDDGASMDVNHLDVRISRANLKMESGKIDFKAYDLEALAEYLKPDVEAELYRWLKDFVTDTFRRKRNVSRM